MTMPTQALLRVLLAEPERDWYGLELCELAGMPSGTVYPILARLEQVGWLESRWEEPETHAGRARPRRRYYRITADGAEQASDAVARAYRARRQQAPAWLPRPGAAGGGS
ncbi:PadR family transcriptional regulator [Nonomuraea deserti]|uniref:PadR family transcriptional regulator n=2 Tax=Nonomuraea deserti TaxID=1848322 RepID=A0A4V2YAN4_9ACTN|nr:PadR family transcriptional regulator [Nonomuraea deserti]